jgi:DNA-binding response OmpR family regulator
LAPSPHGGEPPDERAQRGAPSTVGIILLVLDESSDLPAITMALRARGLRPVILSTVEDAAEMVSRWQPQAVLLQAGRPGDAALLGLLARRGIPCVLLGTATQLWGGEPPPAHCAELLAPVMPEKIAEAALLVIGPAPNARLPDRINLGVLGIDLRTRTVEVQGRRLVVPPKEFEILVQLALQPGTPLSSSELLRRVWPKSPSATVEDVHTRIWRLRRLIGDRQRARPLIVNRRGFGYLLDVAGPPTH